jgi:hypothetical protein
LVPKVVEISAFTQSSDYKPITQDRITAQDKGEVDEWFTQYRKVLREKKMSRKDIWNLDELP